MGDRMNARPSELAKLAKEKSAKGRFFLGSWSAGRGLTESGPNDVVIDALVGTGFRGPLRPANRRVVGAINAARGIRIAVDIPSGVDALSGATSGPVLAATRTVTFGALKPGLLQPPGSELAGAVEIADIGLGELIDEHAHAHLVQAADVASWLPRRAVDAHKWRAAVAVVAGSPGMTGAATLCAHAAKSALAAVAPSTARLDISMVVSLVPLTSTTPM